MEKTLPQVASGDDIKPVPSDLDKEPVSQLCMYGHDNYSVHIIRNWQGESLKRKRCGRKMNCLNMQ